MPVVFFRGLGKLMPLLLVASTRIHAQLVAFDGFGEYAGGAQVESGADGTIGAGLNLGAGWGGAYDINSTIKSKVKIEDRSSSPVNYINGGISILGGNRALRFWNDANGTYALHRPLGTVFHAHAGDTLWCSILFRTGGASPLANQDFFQIGFDNNDNASNGNPRVSFGANTTQTSGSSPYRFFARSTTLVANSDFLDGLDIAAATTYLLVVRIQPNGGVYDTVSLFVNPSTLEPPSIPSAEIVLSSGLSSLSDAFIRTAFLDTGDVHVIDEWHIARDYGSVVRSFQGSLRTIPAALPGTALILRWPVSLSAAVLECSPTLAPDSWTEVPGPFAVQAAERDYPVPADSGTPQLFFRLRR